MLEHSAGAHKRSVETAIKEQIPILYLVCIPYKASNLVVLAHIMVDNIVKGGMWSTMSLKVTLCTLMYIFRPSQFGLVHDT